jgi:hypothetical protein
MRKGLLWSGVLYCHLKHAESETWVLSLTPSSCKSVAARFLRCFGVGWVGGVVCLSVFYLLSFPLSLLALVTEPFSPNEVCGAAAPRHQLDTADRVSKHTCAPPPQPARIVLTLSHGVSGPHYQYKIENSHFPCVLQIVFGFIEISTSKRERWWGKGVGG